MLAAATAFGGACSGGVAGCVPLRWHIQVDNAGAHRDHTFRVRLLLHCLLFLGQQ